MAFGPFGLVSSTVGATTSTYTCDYQWATNDVLSMGRVGGCNYTTASTGAFARALSGGNVSGWVTLPSISMHPVPTA